jgi:DNA-binding response OmpR family regulator
MLPSVSGFDLCRIIRKQSDVPIIMLTARSDETDRVVGLEVGADDYLTKPFSMRELLARVRTILRRAAPPEEPMTRPVQVGELIIDPIRYEVTVSGNRVDLSHRAFQLLLFLASNQGRVFSRQTILERVWGRDNIVEERTVDVHVRWIREKIETDPSHPRYLATVRGVGYKLSAHHP